MSGSFRKFNRRVGITLVTLALLVSIIGFFYTPFDPVHVDLDHRLEAPGTSYFLGSDQFGRDIFSRLLSAAGVSMRVSLFTVLIAVLCGTFLGTLVGYLGGWTDRIAMVCLDALMAIPGILLALTIMVIVGPGEGSLILALGIAYTPTVTRMIRGITLSLRQKEYIEASNLAGDSSLYTMVRHIVPNCITPLTVIATSLFAWALLAESALSFLGLGVPPPYPTWGGMLADGRQYLAIAPWMSIYPGIAISLTLLGINLFGDALRDHFDPKMKNI
ncbi:MAG: ABC transporter permease [Kordiimonadaceae bacterium]|nr:ABC transporter permease [Kordiimonadaceae bacterium]